MRKPVIGVMGGSTATRAVRDEAYRLGSLIAERGWILLNGGRNKGVMEASSAGAKEAGGLVIGVLPDKTDAMASQHLDIAIMTGLNDARNFINVLSSDVIIACPGALGTMSEIVLALKNKKHVILLGYELGVEFNKYVRSGQLSTARTPQEAVNEAAALLAECQN